MAETVSSSDFQQNVGRHLEASLNEPIIITHYGRQRHVLCSHARYSEMWNAWMEKKGELVDATDHPAAEDVRSVALGEEQKNA